MTATAKSICNLGLGKIGASQVSQLDPPRSPVEKHCANGYPNWRDQELTKRAWVFATEWKTLTKTPATVVADDGRVNCFPLPTEMLRPIRRKGAAHNWVQRGRNLWTAQETLTVEGILRVPEATFDPLFVELLACRVAMESTEYITQSNAKTVTAVDLYKEALATAGRNNAFILEPDDTTAEDDEDSWIVGRYA